MDRWYDKETRELLSCPIFRVEEVRRRSEHGKEGDFYVLHAPDWVTVIPLVSDEEGHRCFIMVEQYRHGSGTVTMEFPAGTIDPGEEAEKTALRELREETGYSAGSLVSIGKLSPNSAFMSNVTHTFVAYDLQFEGVQQLDMHESINMHRIPVDNVRERMGTGMYSNAIMAAALMLFNKWNDKPEKW